MLPSCAGHSAILRATGLRTAQLHVNDTNNDSTIFDFGNALDMLRHGQRVSRLGRNGRGMWLALQVPDAHSKMTQPYVYMYTAQGDLVPWLPSQADLLAEDWVAA
jgi:hypothetical protein